MSSLPSSPRCSIIIRAFNEQQHIGRLLSGIEQQSVDSREVILVDSGSTDATLAIASRFPVHIIELPPQEFTFGHALNVGCSHANGEYLVFASAHVFPVFPDWLEQMLRPFEDPRVALVYGKQRGLGSSRFSEQQLFERLYPNRSNASQRHPICNNANAAVQRELWVERPYNEQLPGLEDVEWAKWALDSGHLLAYSAEAEVVHVHDETPVQIYNRYRREAIGLQRVQPETSFGITDFLRLYVSNVLSDLREASNSGVLGKVWREVLWFRLMQFWGTYRGFAYAGPVTSELIHAFYYPKGDATTSEAARRDLDPISYSTPADRITD